jgi:outer membrane immunogenic protein
MALAPALADLSAATAGEVTSSSLPPAFTWSGFYGGQAGGYTFSGDGAAKPDSFWSTAMDAAGSAFTAANGGAQPHNFLGGGQVGFNYQLSSFVFGVEGDLSYTGLSTVDSLAASTTGGNLGFTSDMSSHWLSTMRGRFGTAFDRLLVYTTGGLALAERNFTNGYVVQSPDGQDFSIGSSSRMAAGLAIGGGLEYALTQNWTLKGEYLYANLGAGRSSLDNSTIPTASFHQGDLDEKVVRAALNYKFDWFSQSAPALAK